MGLSTQEQILIEQRVTNEAKSTGVAYLLWLFLGSLGAHRFYLGRVSSGIVMLLLSVLGAFLTILVVGYFLLAAVGIWVIVDAFLIPGMVSGYKNSMRDRLTMEAMRSGGETQP